MFFTQEQLELAQMSAKSQVDLIYDFLGNLTPEQTYALYLLVQGHTVSPANGNITLGIVLAQLRYQHQACMCGKIIGFHTEMAHFEEPIPTAQKSDETADSSPEQPDTSRDKVVHDPETGVTWRARTWAAQDAELSEYVLDNIEEILDKYNLSVNVIPGESTTTGNYICNGCHNTYPSITDRMLKPSDGCQYCQHNQAHGGYTPW